MILFKSCSTTRKNTSSELNWNKGSYNVEFGVAFCGTIKHWIHDMSDNISDYVTNAVRVSKFGLAMQLDELTDVTNCRKFLVHVRFTENGVVKTEVLMNKEVSSTTKRKGIYIVDDFFIKIDLEWSKSVGSTTDNASGVYGKKSEFQSNVKAVSPEIIFSLFPSQIRTLCKGVTF